MKKAFLLVIGLPASLYLPGCASPGSWVDVTAESSSSPYFSVGRPGVYKVEGGLQLEGRVCRTARTTLLSPPRVRLEHIVPDGESVEIAHAPVASIYRNSDQRCSNYGTLVTWTLNDGDSVRACIDRGHACASDSPVKATVAVPTTPPAPKP